MQITTPHRIWRNKKRNPWDGVDTVSPAVMTSVLRQRVHSQRVRFIWFCFLLSICFLITPKSNHIVIQNSSLSAIGCVSRFTLGPGATKSWAPNLYKEDKDIEFYWWASSSSRTYLPADSTDKNHPEAASHLTDSPRGKGQSLSCRDSQCCPQLGQWWQALSATHSDTGKSFAPVFSHSMQHYLSRLGDFVAHALSKSWPQRLGIQLCNETAFHTVQYGTC